MSNLSKFRRVGELHKSRLNSITGWCLVLPDSSKKYSARFFSRTIAPHARAEVHGFIRSTILPTTVLPTSGTPNFQCLHRKYTISSIDSSQRFPRDYYPPYKRAVAKIISSKEFRSKKSLLISQGLWSEDTLQKFERWLLQTKPAVDQRSTVERWCHLREKWMAGLTSKSKNDANDSAEGRRMKSLSCISDLSSQCEALQSKIFTSSSDHNNTFSRMLQYIFHKLIHHCLEGTTSGASILPVVWYKMKESGVVIKQSKIRALLNAMIEPTSTYRLERSSKILLEELVMYHDLLSGEVSGDVPEGSFYQRYPAMLRHHCALGDASAALALLMRIQALPLEILTSEHYMLVLATLAENGHIRYDSLPIKGAQKNGLRHACGVKLFDEIAANMASQVGEITPSSAMLLHNALAKAFESEPTTPSELRIVSTLQELEPLESIIERRRPAKGNELLACRVDIQPSTWVCPVSNTQLRPYLPMEPAKREQMYDDLIALARAQENAASLDELKKFSDWLQNRQGQPFTVILDGSNIGSVESMVASLERKGEYPLVILAEKTAAQYKAGTVYKDESALIYKLRKNSKLYIVPDGFHDDLFCMIATVAEQKTPSQEEVRPILLITNDLFHDHARQMRDPALLREWYLHHCYNHRGSGTTQTPYFAKNLDRRIECNWLGDDGNIFGWCGKVWHFPVSGWGYYERFVIRIPTQPKQIMV